jgi:hypothetical protein
MHPSMGEPVLFSLGRISSLQQENFRHGDKKCRFRWNLAAMIGTRFSRIVMRLGGMWATFLRGGANPA